MVRATIVFTLILVIAGCSDKQRQLHVERITTPEYPTPARLQNAQGTVFVKVAIGPDGKVMFAQGSGAPQVYFEDKEYKSPGAPDMLVKAAEENAKQWTFGPFPSDGEFPVHHLIEYVYKLEGKPLVTVSSPRVTTHLPDRIEIFAAPAAPDKIFDSVVPENKKNGSQKQAKNE